MTREVRDDVEDRFKSLLSKLVRVPKREIDEQERAYQEERQAQKESKKGV